MVSLALQRLFCGGGTGGDNPCSLTLLDDPDRTARDNQGLVDAVMDSSASLTSAGWRRFFLTERRLSHRICIKL